ncbi:hypothetical protein [Sinomonas albida]|uniref:hypothetical protein n=1 Tax=Sinomonas albida TaxID=369942 RepID=UPI00301850B7
MNPTPDPEDLLVIEQFLADAEAEGAEDLRPLLEDLRSLAHVGPVEPSAAVAALLVDSAAPVREISATQSAEPETKTISLDAFRASRASQGARRAAVPPKRRGRRRPLAVALALTAAIGGGTAAAAAADEGFRSSLNQSVSTVLGVLTGHAPAPAEHTSDVPTEPAQPVAPSNVQAPAEPSHAATPGPAAPTQQAPVPAAPEPSPSQKALPGLPSLAPPSLPVPLPPIPSSLPQEPLNPLAPLH